ncbi:hypothetical protein VTO42DRAFT_6519 [Malbranchea cinnamomea]
MTGERRFVCSERGCGKAFFRSEHLSRHQLNHRPKHVYQCQLCPKRFVRKDLLQRHEKRHERGMWYRNYGGVVDALPLCDAVECSRSTHRVETGGPVLNTSGVHGTNGERALQRQPQQQSQTVVVAVPSDTVAAGSSLPPAEVQGSAEMTLPMGMDAGPSSLFLDSSVEVQGQPTEVDWFFEGLAQRLSPIDFAGFPLPNPPYDFVQPVTYPNTTTQHQPPGTLPDFSAVPWGVSSAGDTPFSTPRTTSSLSFTPWSSVRTRLLSALSSVPPDVLESSFFYPTNLSSFYDLYFSNYHPHFPILHRPTLDPAEAEPLLITAIVTLGATLTSDENHYRIATLIHDHLRWLIFGTGAFEPPAPLWCLQTLLIVQAHEKMFSTRKHHEMAHIFHGAVITLMKRGTAYSPIGSQPEHPCTELHQTWSRWVSNEASKRAAFFAFIMDAQHNFLFGHTCILSAHDIQLTLPCSDILWEQPTAEDWNQVRRQTPDPPHFLTTLKGLLAKTCVPSSCSGYSRLILLHGLFSVIAHLHARDLATLGVGRPTSSSEHTSTIPPPSSASSSSATLHAIEIWKDILERAIDTWSFSLLTSETSLSIEAARTLHHIAHVAIYTNMIDFHTVAGAPPLLGTVVSRHDYVKARTHVSEWSKKPESKKAVYHCLRLIHDTMFTGQTYRASNDNIALRPWCLYHATLVVWAYGQMVAESNAKNGKKKKNPRKSTNANRTMAVRAKDYLTRMLFLLQGSVDSNGGMSRKKNGTFSKDSALWETAHQTHDLVLFVRDSLANCRWELLQEAYTTLGKVAGLCL